MMHVKKNDMVVILVGKDKGKRGLVLEVCPKIGKVKVQGIAIVTRHVKVKRQGDVGGIQRSEGYISSSNVMPIDPSTNKPCRTNSIVSETGVRVRVSNITKEAF